MFLWSAEIILLKLEFPISLKTNKLCKLKILQMLDKRIIIQYNSSKKVKHKLLMKKLLKINNKVEFSNFNKVKLIENSIIQSELST